MSTRSLADRRRGGCPLCSSPASPGHAPFCSARCRDRDLLQWLGDGYRIAGPPLDEDDAPGLDKAGERP